MPTAPSPLIVSLVGASILRESELPGFETVSDFASESYNLAIASIKACVIQAPDLVDRVQVHLADFDVSWDRKTLGDGEAHAVATCNPHIIGLSCYCWNIDTLLELAKTLRRLLPSTLIVLGGPSAGPDARNILHEQEAVDAIVLGEGESSFLDLLRARLHNESLHRVPSLIWRSPTGEIVENELHQQPIDLAALPSPYRLGITRPIGTSLLLETSRGCRFHCRFCSWMGGGRRLRYVPIEQVEADLRWAVDNGYRSIKLADTAINFQTERLGQIADAIGHADPDRCLRFTYFLKPELLDEEQVSLLEKIPSDEIIIGVESLTAEARKRAGKAPFDPVEFERQVAWLHRVGPVTASFILGLPGDTPEGLNRTLDWLIQFDREHPGWLHVLCLFWLAVLPGAGLHTNKNSLGFRLMPKETPYVLQSHEHTPDDLLCMARHSIERHYGHPKLRVEYFQKEYLMQDAPESDRKVLIPRIAMDERPCVLLVGGVDRRWEREFNLRPYNLRMAWLKAWLETWDDLRRTWRIELVHEGDDVASYLAKNQPSWLIGSFDGQGGPMASLSDAIATMKVRPSLVFEGARSSDQARSWMKRFPIADFVLVGEGEMAMRGLLKGDLDVPGLVRRVEDGWIDTGAPRVLSPLDQIPSPFQWGFLQRPGSTIVMKLGRKDPLRTFSTERIFRDMRWAMEQRHDHIVWLDDSLPSEREVLQGFVEAIRRADPEGRVRHSYRLDGSQDPDGLHYLLRLPVRTIHLTGAQLDKAWRLGVERLVDTWGGRLTQQRSARRVLTALAPLKRTGALEGWLLEKAHIEENEVHAIFRWKQEGIVKVHLKNVEQQPIDATFHVQKGPRPPPHDLDRLRKVVGLLLERCR